MGYGHLRAAAALAEALDEPLLEVDRPPIASPGEARLWRRARGAYEGLSRWSQLPLIGGPFAALLERMTRIPPLAAPGELRTPVPAVEHLHRLVAAGLGAGLARHLDSHGRGLLTTFYAPAIAVDQQRAGPVACVITDSDAHRIWAPMDASSSRILYLTPGRRAADRMRAYGVRSDRIVETGFPLPRTIATSDPGPRIARLEGRGDRPPTVVFAVGGAGAQSGRARQLVRGLREPIQRGDLRLVLVAGTRLGLGQRFRLWRSHAGLSSSAVEVVAERDFATYLARFQQVLIDADVLWTKPSEMVFYAAMGLPLVLDVPVGDQERANAEWIVGLGAARWRPEPDAITDTLQSWLTDGSLARCARHGWDRVPRDGTRRIVEAVFNHF